MERYYHKCTKMRLGQEPVEDWRDMVLPKCDAVLHPRDGNGLAVYQTPNDVLIFLSRESPFDIIAHFETEGLEKYDPVNEFLHVYGFHHEADSTREMEMKRKESREFRNLLNQVRESQKGEGWKRNG